MPRPSGRHAVCQRKGPHGIGHHCSVPGPGHPCGPSSLTSYGSVGGEGGLGCQAPTERPRSASPQLPPLSRGHRTGTGRGMCYSRGSLHHTQPAPGLSLPRPKHTHDTGRQPVLPPDASLRLLYHLTSAAARSLGLTRQSPPRRLTTRAARPQLPFLPGKQGPSRLPPTPASEGVSHVSRQSVCLGKSLSSPASTRPVSVLVHVYSGLQNFQLPVSVIIQFPNY